MKRREIHREQPEDEKELFADCADGADYFTAGVQVSHPTFFKCEAGRVKGVQRTPYFSSAGRALPMGHGYSTPLGSWEKLRGLRTTGFTRGYAYLTPAGSGGTSGPDPDRSGQGDRDLRQVADATFAIRSEAMKG